MMSPAMDPYSEDSRATGSDYADSPMRMQAVLTGKNLKPREYNGEGSWISLSGAAAEYAEELPMEKTSTYQTLCVALFEQLEQLSRKFIIELDHRRRQQNESLPALGQDIRRLTCLAYPSQTKEGIEGISREFFIEALPAEALRLQIRHARLTTMEEAVEFAIHIEVRMMLEEYSQKN